VCRVQRIKLGNKGNVYACILVALPRLALTRPWLAWRHLVTVEKLLGLIPAVGPMWKARTLAYRFA
jgi:hypothetical protein